MIALALLASLGHAEEDFGTRLTDAIRQAAAEEHDLAPEDVEVLSSGFGGRGCGDAVTVSARSGADYAGTIDLVVVARAGEAECGQWRVRARTALWMTLPVAAETTAAGQFLSLREERVRIERPLGTPVSMSGGPYVARTVVRSGQVVVAELAKVPPDVDAGQTVKIEVRAGNLTILSEGVLAQPGDIGASVRVRSAATDTIVTGVLVASDHVIIE
ncbi:MAG: hypothetical protein ACI8S6_005791 [Myxococcota bacterium]|jgi:hypothetical protein